MFDNFSPRYDWCLFAHIFSARNLEVLLEISGFQEIIEKHYIYIFYNKCFKVYNTFNSGWLLIKKQRQKNYLADKF